MKHLDDSHRAYFAELLECSDIEVGSEESETMLSHLDWILEWNDRINLTAIADPREAIRLHLVDSLLAAEVVRSTLAGRMCDLGSGAGFPGIPLAVVTGRDTELVESVKKKVGVVEGFLASANNERLAKISTVALRAEEYAVQHPGEISVVTARALSQLGSLIELSSPLLLEGGSLVALKGALSADELHAASGVAELTGMEITQVHATRLPVGGETRTLVTVTKVGESSIPLPRRNGLAQRDPLAASRKQRPRL